MYYFIVVFQVFGLTDRFKKIYAGGGAFLRGSVPSQNFRHKNKRQKVREMLLSCEKRNAFNRTIARSHEIVQQEVGWVVFGVKFESIYTVFCELKSRGNPRIALRASVKLVETFLVLHGEITPINRKASIRLRRSL